MTTRRLTTTSAALVVAFAFCLHAASVSAQVINPSFEDDVLPNSGNQFFDADPTGWTTTGFAGGQRYNGTFTPAATDGDHHAHVSGGATMSQLLSDVITDGEIYTLTVDVGQVSAFSGSTAEIQLYGSTAGLGTPLSNANGTAELTGIAPASGTYITDLTLTYTALASGDPFAGQSLGIGLIGESGTQVIFDNVRLDIASAPAPVPEPASVAIWSLMGLGLVGFGMYRARRKK